MLNRFGNAERFFQTLPPRLWLASDPGGLQSEKQNFLHFMCADFEQH